MSSTLVFAALPEEYRCLLKAGGPWRSVCRRPFRKFRRTLAGGEWTLVETGMGRERIMQAMAWAVREEPPDMIFSVGFCGGLSEALPVGSVVLGQSFRFLQPLDEQREIESLGYQGAGGAIEDVCRALHVQCAQVVTLLRPQAKQDLHRLFLATTTVIDMESYFAACFARQQGIPFLCLRAVSDGVHDEIGFDLDAISTNGRVRIFKVLLLLCQKPNLLPVFYQAWRRSQRAAKKLTEALLALMYGPASAAAKFTRESKLYNGLVGDGNCRWIIGRS